MTTYKFWSVAILSALVVIGCGKSNQVDKTASLLDESDYEMLAGVEESLGNANAAVEVISVPQAPQIAGVSSLDAENQVMETVGPIATDASATASTIATPAATTDAVTTTPAAKPAQSESGISYEKKVQIALKEAGFYQGKIDGVIGKGTKEAIKAFQKANALTDDGMVGPTTWAKLKAHYYQAGHSETSTS